MISSIYLFSVQDDPDAVPDEDRKVERWMEEQEPFILPQHPEWHIAKETQCQQRATFLARKTLGPNSIAAIATLADGNIAVCKVSKKRKVTTLILDEQLKTTKTLPFSYSAGMVSILGKDGNQLLVSAYSGSNQKVKDLNILVGWDISTLPTSASLLYVEHVLSGPRWTKICNFGSNKIACWNTSKTKKGQCISVNILDTTVEPFQCVDVFNISQEIKQVRDMCYLEESCFGPLLIVCCPNQQFVMAYSYPSGDLCWSLDKKSARNLFFENFQPCSVCPG